ncbi:coiled-coil and C2 domain-containing protein 2A-like [Belonocnema kinseyi]|uniref:coiled-coil and C2 domain-containing protein 2A-like n=1 Tax=Belonocnema kinseyi TaxID=2817044 RepID=UPI00143D3F16|nr:coiled-coil and C2 domain-containing protein 2A-like [Belonocnema kinseyi]
MNCDSSNENAKMSSEKSIPDLGLCSTKPAINNIRHKSVVQTTKKIKHQKQDINENCTNDGFNSISTNSSIYNILTCFHNDQNILNGKENLLSSYKLLEIAIREVTLEKISKSQSEPVLKITSILILFKDTVICKATSPFNQNLHKLLLQNQSSNFNELSIRINAQCGTFSILPFPLPRKDEQNTNLEIQFAIKDKFGKVYSGILICMISLILQGQAVQWEPTSYGYSTLKDPNDPQNSIFLLPVNNRNCNEEISFFSLNSSALGITQKFKIEKSHKKYASRPLEFAVSEQKISVLNLITMFQNKRLLDVLAVQNASRNHAGRKPVLSITILRGVEVPVREETAIVHPLVEIELGDAIQSTFPAEGSAPVWHQTLMFPVSRFSIKQYVTLRLYDQHPIWGLQWLGECKIPIECHREYEELERWIGLDPLQSPALLLGYVQASPGRSFTRIYVLMKMKQMGVSDTVDIKTMDKLSTKMQRCLAVAHKIPELNDPEEVAHLTMLLSPLSIYYEPLTPRQALNLGQVDYYGRAVLLTSLLQGLGHQAYMILGESQTRNWAAFALTVEEDINNTIIWDPETGDCFELGDSRSPLIKVLRLINHQNVWVNAHKIMSPVDLKYNPKVSTDWQPLDRNFQYSEDLAVRTVDFCNSHLKTNPDFVKEMENQLKEELSNFRKELGNPTVFNRHATLILQDFLSKNIAEANIKLNKKGLRQLYRAYYTRGFILKLRYMNLKDLSRLLFTTKVHSTRGPVEFGLACHIQNHIGSIQSIWIAIVLLKRRK